MVVAGCKDPLKLKFKRCVFDVVGGQFQFQCFNMISHAKFEVLPRPFFVSIIT